jgi:proteasome lid subunit RPN8/RPN11
VTTIDIRAIETTELKVKAFPEVDQGFRVVMAESALDRCVERGSADMTREIGGIWVGEVLKDDSGPYVRVDDTVDALHADEKGAELTFTHETWEHINKEMDTKHEGKKIVGWYHTHPGFGVFLSDRDEFIHKSFFDQPFQIALVYDPKTREQGVFAWKKGSTARMNRYWIGRQEHNWQRPAGPEITSSSDTVKAVAAAPERDSEDYGRIDWGATAMVGLVMLMLGGAGGWWMGSGSSAQTQGQLQAQLVDAKYTGAQEAIRTLDMRIMGAVRAGFDNTATNEAIGLIDDELRAASAALGGEKPAAPGAAPAAPAAPASPATPDPKAKQPEKEAPAAPAVAKSSDPTAKAVAHIEQARAVARALARQRGSVSAGLRELEQIGSRSQNGKLDAKSLSVQRAALATLYADLSRDFKKAGDTKRAARYLDVAKTVNPKSGRRYDKHIDKAKPGQTKPGEQKKNIRRPGMKP